MDARAALAAMLGPHMAGCPKLTDVVRYLASDQAGGFYLAPFNRNPKSRFAVDGGLVQAMLQGYKALRLLERTATALFSPVQLDRLVLLYVVLMISRWADLRDGKVIFSDQGARGSISTTTLTNCLVFGITDLTAAEVQAITSWARGRTEMVGAHEPFNPAWWVLNQTMDFVFIAGGTP